MENPKPIEETDPELAELIKEYVNTSKIFKGIDIRKLGRNDICPCGSGKKLKKCHWYFIESRLY